MHSGRLSVGLLSAVTTRDRAESIIGDLHEESHQQPNRWLVLRVTGTAIALCLQNIRRAPLRSLVLALQGLAAYGCILAMFLVVSGLPWYTWNRVYEPTFWVRLAVVVAAANLTAGFVLRRWVSLNGTSAIVPVLPLWLAAWPVTAIFKALVFPGIPPAGMLALVAFPVLALLPLVAGAALAAREHGARPPRTTG
jgi:hypothetical protein